MESKFNIKNCGSNDDESNSLNYSGMVHSKKVVKHALRQQVKRRKKNTTIAAGNSRTLPRIISSLPSAITSDLSLSGISDQPNHIVVEETAATMKDVLASLPGFSIKSNRRRSTKRLSVAAQLEAGLVDLESPASILANTSLRVLLNRHTFQGLPPLYQRKLAQLLPTVDRQDAATSGLNNEFFARACQEWRKRLAEGEFTPENQQRLKMEAEKDKNKLDPWKLKHFEPIWGEKREMHKLRSGLHSINKEQKFTKVVTRSNSRYQTASNSNLVLTDRQSPNTLSTEEKVLQNISTLVKNQSVETHSASLNDDRTLPKFNVTVRILEDEDDENEDDDDEDDEEEDDDDEEEDEDDEEDDDDEDDEDDDELETQVSLTYLNDEAQHCRAIIVASASKEQMYKEQKLSAEIPVIEKTKYTKEMILDFINDRKYIDVDMKVQEQKHELHRRSIEGSLKSSIKGFSYINSSFIDEESEKAAKYSILENPNQLTKLSEMHLPEHQNIQMCHDSMSKLKFTMKDETFIDDIRINIKATEKEKLFQNSALCRQEDNQIGCEDTNNVTTEISSVIEIDNETLQRIHELEVRGEMQEAYEEISGCPGEMMYPMLEDIEMTSSSTKICETQIVPEITDTQEINDNVSTRTQEEAFQEANNYVCSEMLDCSWTSSASENTVSNNREELQVPWPLVAAVLDNTVPTNVTIATSNGCSESQTFMNQKVSRQQNHGLHSIDENADAVNCIQLPVTAFNSDALRITAPVTSCLMKNVHTTQSSSIITFPQLQSIRFVQTNFQTTIEHSSSESAANTTSLCAQIQNSTEMSQQSQNLSDSSQTTELGRNKCGFEDQDEFQNRSQNITPRNSVHQKNMQTQSTIVLQQQTLLPLSSRQIITTLQPQHQCQYPMIMNVPSKSNRSTGVHNAHRSIRNGNREQGNGRSRNVTKEPPGAVNLERSYQICQAVIASSPNRDQLKAHLRPPPSLLSKGEKILTNNKFSTRTSNTKSQKTCFLNQDGTNLQNKPQAPSVMLKHVFTTARQHYSGEILENNTVGQMSYSNPGLEQYILFKRTGTNESAPRASSAPPMPPQIAGMSIGVHVIRGRPASAGENSHQAVALKSKGTDYYDNGGAESDNPNIIVGGNLPSSCDCNIQGAMIICRQCGAFCHDNCLGTQCICAVCLIR